MAEQGLHRLASGHGMRPCPLTHWLATTPAGCPCAMCMNGEDVVVSVMKIWSVTVVAASYRRRMRQWRRTTHQSISARCRLRRSRRVAPFRACRITCLPNDRRERQPVVVSGWRRDGLRRARRRDAGQLGNRVDQHFRDASLDRDLPGAPISPACTRTTGAARASRREPIVFGGLAVSDRRPSRRRSAPATGTNSH